MELQADQILSHYVDAYQKLYNRMPKDVHAVDDEWVVVNGARMRVTELDYLTKQLQQEYTQGLEQKRNIVVKLMKWFKGT
jgi:hypothetical protein